jgi:ribose 5-phosphate isomerase B
MRIAITADHNGTALRQQLSARLVELGHTVEDRAGNVGEDVVDYPLLCADLADRVLDGHADFGIVLGGSGCGESIACNKIRGVRAVLCHCLFTAQIARAHNDANVLVMGAKVVSPELAEQILDVWLSTPFKGERHQLRLDMVAALERGESLAGAG